LKGGEAMGIRFFCPNGHKLNVKEHLAGKAGFCPECGVRLVIPYQSTRKSSRELNREQTDNNAPFGMPSLDMTPSAFFSPETQQPISQPLPSPVPISAGPPIANPIFNDTSVRWYIQVPNDPQHGPAAGQQYGPATGQVVQTWIQERRIGPTMLVWREGWDQWLEAKNVFPDLE